jgi:hypothetical protein
LDALLRAQCAHDRVPLASLVFSPPSSPAPSPTWLAPEAAFVVGTELIVDDGVSQL